jgi:DNA-binding CsgD family transcriptional regulator
MRHTCLTCFPESRATTEEIIPSGFGSLVRKYVGKADKSIDTLAGWEARFIALLSEKWKLIDAAGRSQKHVTGLRTKNPQLSDAEIENILRCVYVRKAFENLIISVQDPARSSEASVARNSNPLDESRLSDGEVPDSEYHNTDKQQDLSEIEDAVDGTPENAPPVHIDVYRYKTDVDGFLNDLVPHLRQEVEDYWKAHPEKRPAPLNPIIGAPAFKSKLPEAGDEDDPTVEAAPKKMPYRAAKLGFTEGDLMNALTTMSAEDQEFIHQRFEAGHTLKEMAQKLGISIKRTRTREKKVVERLIAKLCKNPVDNVRNKMTGQELLQSELASNAERIAAMQTQPRRSNGNEWKAALRPRTRQAWDLFEIGKTEAEIAAIMNVGVKDAGAMVMTAKRLRDRRV